MTPQTHFARALSSARSLSWESWAAYVLAPLLVAFSVVSMAFEGNGVLPIDIGDEPAETFVGVPMAMSQLAKGDILRINLFNNFGTPILGEPVIYPFALHSTSYALFRPVVAAVVNKFVLALASMVVLTIFFSRYFSPLISSFCAFLVFSAPTCIYFFHNHPHQGVLAYYGFILLVLQGFLEGPTRGKVFCLYAAFLLFFLSVGINGVLLGSPFIAAYVVLLAQRRWKLTGWVLVLWALALVAVHPHFWEFFKLAGISARKGLNYQQIWAIPATELILQLCFGSAIWRGAWNPCTVHYSWPVIALIGGGMFLAASRQRERSRGAGSMAPPGLVTPELSPGGLRGSQLFNGAPAAELCRLGLWLGIAPLVVVLICRLAPSVPGSIPMIKSMNLSRTLWFSDIFLMLWVGLALGSVWRLLRNHAICRALWIVAIALVLLQRYATFHSLANFYRLRQEAADFYPKDFLGRMQPGLRLATLIEPASMSWDTKCNRHEILGSGGRSIILSKAFRDFLEKHDLIDAGIYGMTYYFRAAPPEVLALLGIRYCIAVEHQSAEGLVQWGWKDVCSFAIRDKADGPTLYNLRLLESPYPVTPLYCQPVKKGNGQVNVSQILFLQRYQLGGNQIKAELPPLDSPSELVATFVAWPGWKAFIDGRPVSIQPKEDQFIRVPVTAGKEILLRYEPYSNGYLAGCFLGSIAGAVLLARCVFPRARHNSDHRSRLTLP
jgi:hypothetical protein